MLTTIFLTVACGVFVRRIRPICPCPDHRTNYVGVAYKPYRLNATFDYPMTVGTNLTHTAAPDMKLVTNVRLPGGNVHLELVDATAPFTVWYYEHRAYAYRKLLDTATTPVKDLPMAYWKVLMRRAVRDDGQPNEMPIYITSPTPGKVKLLFRYWTVIDGQFVPDTAVPQITSVKPPLRLDITRDGMIDDGDVVANLARKVFYFWTNEDFWKNDDAFDGEDPSSLNVSDLFVNGRNDLINLLPVAVDIFPFIHAWGNSVTFRIRGNSLVRYAIADIDWEYADQMHIDDCLTTVGGAIRTAPLTALSVDGAPLGANEKSLSLASSLTLLLEAAQPCSDPVEIAVEIDGKTVFSYRAPLTFSRVRAMYRWFNRRNAAGGEVTDEDRPWDPVGWPDADRDGGANGPMLVFVHGYNVAEWEARAWSDGVFKRLWWSGLNAKFAAVAWRGDEGQVYFPSQGLITPNYQVNVEHAFATAPALSTLLNGLPGDKYILAHSLGNMVVSSAIQDHGLQCKKYFMLNAAVPVEAYDATCGVTAESKAGMTNPEWTNYPDRVRASHWWELFSTGDGRRTLTWKGRFVNVTNTVNYFSSEEEVLANGNGTLPNLPRKINAWSDQEMWKGNKPFTDVFFFSMGRNEGGWAFNSDHDVYEQPPGGLFPTTLRRRTPDETTNITDVVLRECPFFGHFADRSIYVSTNGVMVATNVSYRAQLLADAIPTESFAAGANRVPAWGDEGKDKCNVNMAGHFKDKDQFCHSSCQNWIHSLFLRAPYVCIHEFYENIVSRIPKENPNE